MNNLQARLTLHLTPNLGEVGCKRLLEVFGNASNVFAARPAELLRVKGVQKSALAVLAHKPPFAAMEKEMAATAALGIKIICFEDPEYPPLLRAIFKPPGILYLRGRFELLNTPAVAIVGSRAATAYGLKVARQMAADLSCRGMLVVSGMAMGIDTAAHAGSLAKGAPTIAVLGCGVDVVYPRQNTKLYGNIIQKGLVVSEYPLGTPPEGFRFPARNRIISGMAMGVVVVEAAKKSGSLITARMALEEGREVFAIPGRIDSFKSAGTHHLLQEGAKLVNTVDDILEELPVAAVPDGAASGEQAQEPDLLAGLPPEAAKVFKSLDAYPEAIDNLVVKSGLPVAKINEIMLLLEIRGLVQMAPGSKFSLTNKGMALKGDEQI